MNYRLFFLLPILLVATAAKRNPNPQGKADNQLPSTTKSKKISSESKTKAVIFSWCSIFEPDEKDIERRVRERLGLLRSIGLLFSGIPKKEVVKEQLFSLLNKIPADAETGKNEYPSWETDYQLPPIFEQHLLSNSEKEEQKVYKKVFDFLDTTPEVTSESRRKTLKGVADFIFQQEYMNQAMQPVNDMVQLAKKLKTDGYTIILVGNCPGYAWDQFLEHFEVAKIVTELFSPENRFISGKEKALKTSKTMYKKILKTHKLDPQDYLVIECNGNNLTYPKQLGMKTAVFNPQQTDFNKFSEQLALAIS